MRTPISILIGVLSASISVFVSVAAAETAGPAAEPVPAIFTIIVNEVAHGERIVYLRGPDVLVAAEDLDGAGLTLPDARSETIREARYVSLAAAAPALVYAVDQHQLALRITADPDLLPATRIDLGRRRAPVGVSYDRDPSLFVNYAVHAFNDRLQGYGEGGFSAGDMLLHSTMTVSPEGQPVRGPSILTWDDRDDLRRLGVGDRFASGGALGGGAFVGGVHLGRSFELDPYLVLQPTLAQTGTVVAPSTAEVYVNGSLVGRHQLAPGSFHIDDLPVSSGAGDARVVIRDGMGRTQEIGGGYYLAPNLLAPGLSDYQLAVGAVRDGVGVSSFDYGEPVAVGRYRRGLSRSLTAGGRAEGSLEVASGGLELTMGTRLGEIGLAGAASTGPERQGAAGLASWGYRGRRFGLGTAVRVTSDHYATIDVGADDDRALLDVRGQLSLALTRRMSLGAHGAWTEHRDTGSAARATLTSSVQPATGWTLSASLGAVRPRHGADELAGFVTLSIGLGHRTRGTLTHESGDVERSRGEVRRSVPDRTGLGYHVLAETGDRERGYAAIDAHADFGRYRAGYQWTGTESQVEASVAGGVVVIGGRVFATQPVERGFALVRVPGAGGVRAYLENREIGRTDDRGDLLITELQPYYGNRIAIAPLDLSDDQTVARTSALIAPPRLGGAVVSFPTRRLRVVRGDLRVRRGEAAIIPAYGQLDVGEVSSPIGAGGEFELDGVDGGRRQATLVWDGGRCQFELEVPDAARPIVEIGTIECAEVIR